MRKLECSTTYGRFFPKSNRTFVRLRFVLICALICCAVVGCGTHFFIHGKVVDADGNPIADAKLVITAINNEFISSHRVSDAKGAFTFEEITSSSVDVSIISLSVEKSGFAPVKVRLSLGNHYNDAEIVLVRLE